MHAHWDGRDDEPDMQAALITVDATWRAGLNLRLRLGIKPANVAMLANRQWNRKGEFGVFVTDQIVDISVLSPFAGAGGTFMMPLFLLTRERDGQQLRMF